MGLPVETQPPVYLLRIRFHLSFGVVVLVLDVNGHLLILVGEKTQSIKGPALGFNDDE